MRLELHRKASCFLFLTLSVVQLANSKENTAFCLNGIRASLKANEVKGFFADRGLFYEERSGWMERDRKHLFTMEVTEKGHEIAECTYFFDPESKQLELYFTFIAQDEKYLKQGFSTQFLDRVLAQFPEVQSLRAKLIYENEIVFRAAKGEGQSVSKSFEGTPFYKTAKKFGFEEIDDSASSERVPLVLTLKRR